MNVREKILLQIENDLANLRVQYGYELDYANIVKGNIPIENVKNFPTVCYDVGSENSSSGGEANYQNIKSTSLILWVYVSDFKEKGKIINIREQAISDLNKFLIGDSSIQGYSSLDWKVFRLYTIEGIAGYELNMDHSTNYTDGRALIVATLNISYYDFHSENINYQNI